MATLVVASWRENFSKELIFYSSHLWETIYYFSGFSIDIYILRHCPEVVLCNYFILYDVYG